MGQILNKNAKREQSQTLQYLIFQFKRVTLKEIVEVVQYIHNQFPKCYTMIYEIFDEIFGTLMDDSQPLFDRLSENKLVNIYESLAVFTIFCGDTFENKTAFLFRLFDFDSSFTLAKDELVKTIYVILKGIAKVVELPVPKENLVKQLAESCFQLMDEDQSGYIDYNEFKIWIESDFELQDFLLKYASTNTYTNAKRRMNNQISQFEDAYNKESNNNNFLIYPKLEQIVRNNLKEFEKELIDSLLEIIIQNTERNKLVEDDFKEKSQTNIESLEIKRRDFLDVMRAWCAFSASDYNQTNVLYIRDLKIMFWVYEDEEPDHFRLKQEMNQIDSDKSGTVERLEWMQYLISEDKTDGHAFKSTMKKVYEQFQNEQGLIDIKQTQEIIQSSFKNKILKASKHMQEQMRKNIDKIAQDIMREFSQKEIFQVNWKEFKFYVDNGFDKNQHSVKYLDSA